MTSAITGWVCGDHGTHREGCPLGVAETVAYAAADANPTSPMPAVLTALVAAGLIHDPDEELDEVVNGLLDAMYELGLLGGAK